MHPRHTSQANIEAAKQNATEAADQTDNATPVPPVRVPVHFDARAIDQDAYRVVMRLVRSGHEAYLVGGGVRDLLLGFRPKDFDIATSARPEQVRRLFRNSRIIGRRFRLVHVIFRGAKLIEVATFRRTPSSLATGAPGNKDDLLIVRDNEYGRADEDAIRRDLTINALLYDVQSNEVLDFVDGMPDIRARVVRTIGDPNVRFREDPARMLRAIKFTARLDLGMAPEVYDAIVQHREGLADLARPRLLEEIFKLMRSGASHRSIWLCWETGLLSVMLPELAMFLDDTSGEPAWERFWQSLTTLDTLTKQMGPRPDAALFALLLLEPLRHSTTRESSRAAQAREVLMPVIERLAVPRRLTDAACRIIAAEEKIARGRPGKFARTQLYPVAMEVFQASPPDPVKPRRRAPKPRKDSP